jgi:hypothetical protein
MADLFYVLASLGASKILFNAVSGWFADVLPEHVLPQLPTLPTAVPPVEALSSTPQLLYVGGGITVIVVASAFFRRRLRPRRSRKPFPTGLKLLHDAGDSIVE